MLHEAVMHTLPYGCNVGGLDVYGIGEYVRAVEFDVQDLTGKGESCRGGHLGRVGGMVEITTSSFIFNLFGCNKYGTKLITLAFLN